MSRKLYPHVLEVTSAGISENGGTSPEAERLAQATLDALPVHACVLDEDGVILTVNRAWREFAQANPPLPAHYLEGANYLEVCDRASGPHSAEAAAFAAGIRAVLRGEVEQFSLEYACPAPWEERWFVGLVTRFSSAGSPRVVVSHQNITNPKQAELALRGSEERLNLALSTADMGVWEQDFQASTVFWSPECYQIMGVGSFDGMLLSFGNFLHPEDKDRIIALFNQAMTERTTFAAEFRIIRPDGQVRWVSNLGQATYDENGVPVRVVGTIRDITSRKEAEEALRRSEDRHRVINELISDYIYSGWLYPDGRVETEWVVGAFERITGYTFDEANQLAGGYAALIHPDDQVKANPTPPMLVAGQPSIHEYRIVTKSGQVRWLRDYSQPLEAGPEAGLWHILGAAQDITTHKQAEETLRENQHNLQALIENTDGAIWSVDSEYRLLVGNRLFHAGMQDVIGREVMPGQDLTTLDLPPTLVDQAKCLCDRALRGESFNVEIATRLLPGMRAVEYRLSPIRTAKGQITGVTIFGRDITKRKDAEAARTALEEQLLQAHKMESVGRLAGGVAHDFNNLLTVIRGYSDLLRHNTAKSDPRLDMIEQICQATERAAGLTRQLLAFSRRQVLAPVMLDLNELVTNLNKMLGRLIGEDIALAILLQPELWPITADPGQLEQVIINLAVNARDAMPTGGKLTIETGNMQPDPGFTRTHPEAPTGPCVQLTLSDTGHGMAADILAHMFEPFFTTKVAGQGTGLGLATVYGIVKQSGGDITVESKLGQGTTFRIYLPADQTTPVRPPAPVVEMESPRGSETILVVEDEPSVRNLVLKMLADQGYTLLEAGHGQEALALVQQHSGPIDLLLADVVMPEMSGRELAEQLKVLYPHLKVLFMSGYTDDVVVRHGLLTAQTELLPKPFSPLVLAVKIRELLDK